MHKEDMMTLLRRIIVGQSFFPDGDIAVQAATVLAERAGAALYLLHVVEPYHFYERMRFPTVSVETMLDEIVVKMRAQLQELAQRPELGAVPR